MHHLEYDTAPNELLRQFEMFRRFDIPHDDTDDSMWRILIKNKNGKILAGQYFDDRDFLIYNVKPHEVDDLIDLIKQSYSFSGRGDRLSKAIFYNMVDVKRAGVNESAYPEIIQLNEDQTFDFLLFLKSRRLYLDESLFAKGASIAKQRLNDLLASDLSYTELKKRTRPLSTFIQIPIEKIESRKKKRVREAAGAESAMEKLIRKRGNARSRVSRARKANDEDKLQLELEKLQEIENQIERQRMKEN